MTLSRLGGGAVELDFGEKESAKTSTDLWTDCEVRSMLQTRTNKNDCFITVKKKHLL